MRRCRAPGCRSGRRPARSPASVPRRCARPRPRSGIRPRRRWRCRRWPSAWRPACCWRTGAASTRAAGRGRRVPNGSARVPEPTASAAATARRRCRSARRASRPALGARRGCAIAPGQQRLFLDDARAVEFQAQQRLAAQACRRTGCPSSRGSARWSGRPCRWAPPTAAPSTSSGCSKPGFGAFLADARADAVVAAVGDAAASRSCAPARTTLSSSPPCGPCSVAHNSPVCGCSAAPCMLRWPRLQISGRAPAVATKGLSAGTLPSASMRTTLPRWLSSVCASSLREKRSPSTTNRRPSRANTSREPKCSCARHLGQLPEDHLHLAQPVALQLAARHRRAVAAVAGLGIAPVDPVRCRRTSGPAPRRAGRTGRRASTAGSPATGSPSAAVALDDAQPPGRSVTSKRPSGRKASAQGLARPRATLTGLQFGWTVPAGRRSTAAGAAIDGAWR